MAYISPSVRKEIGKYVRSLANSLGLRDWTIELVHRPSDLDAMASIEVTYGQKHAWIYLAEKWESFDPEEQRETLIHELLHCHVNPIREQVNTIEHSVGQMILSPLKASLLEREEQAVNAIAESIAKHYPLPKRTTITTTSRIARTKRDLKTSEVEVEHISDTQGPNIGNGGKP